MTWNETNADQDDPILDACLEEVLANRTPPDVTPRVLRALGGATLPEPPPILAQVGAAPSIVVISPRGDVQSNKLPAPSSTGLWSSAIAIAIAAGVIGVGLTVGLASLFRDANPQVVQKQPAPPTDDNADIAPVIQPRIAAQPRIESRPANIDKQSPAIITSPAEPPPAQLAADTTASPTLAASAPAVPVTPEPAPRSAPSSEQVISFVNAELKSAWTSAGVSASAAITDDEWCARAFQRTLGRGPNAAELKQFQDDEASSRRDLLLDRILGEQYHNLFSRHWAKILASEFLGSTVPRPGSLASRDDLEKYLTAALRTNKPLTQIVTELLTAKGASQPGPGYNPAVNFLIDGWEPAAHIATSRVARVFLGQRLECAQCHQHPSAAWSQDQYWSFNAFFRQMKVEKTEESTRLVNVNFPGERRGSSDGEVYYETPDGVVKSAWPQFLTGVQIGKSGQLSVVDRRAELARLVTQSEYLPRAVVNHVWTQYFDYGLLPSLYDLGQPRSALHEELLDRLASEFAASGLDLKSLIRWTVMSDAFARSTKLTDLATKDMPEAGEPALFSRFYSRPPAGAELLTSLAQAQRIRRTAGTSAERDQARVDWLAQFNRAPTKATAKAVVKNSAILAEASTIRTTAGLQPTGIVPKMAAHSMSFDLKVEHLFLTALGRRPNQREVRAATTALSAAADNQSAALEDIWWSLLNSNECVLDR